MEKIYEILKKIRPEEEFTKMENFIEEGALDSMDMIELISELEDTFEIMIDSLDILPENFENAEKIYALVLKSGGK